MAFGRIPSLGHGFRRQKSLPESVQLPGGVLPLQLCRDARAKRLSLRLCASTRSVRLTVPQHVGEAHALAFLEQNRGWLARQADVRLLPPVPFAPGILLPVAGVDLLLTHGEGRITRRVGGQLQVPGDDMLFAARVRRWLQAEALRVLEAETHPMAALLGRQVKQVRIGDFRSRWGSCASDGRIAYSWRLLLAPTFVRQAVVAHEVAHLVEMNHSARFWKTATLLLGRPHDEARRWLKANAPQLLRYGAS